MSSLGDFPECKQFWTQYRHLSSFFPFDAFRPPTFVVFSLQSATVGNCTVKAGEQTSMHASLDTWHASLSMPGHA